MQQTGAAPTHTPSDFTVNLPWLGKFNIALKSLIVEGANLTCLTLIELVIDTFQQIIITSLSLFTLFLHGSVLQVAY